MNVIVPHLLKQRSHVTVTLFVGV